MTLYYLLYVLLKAVLLVCMIYIYIIYMEHEVIKSQVGHMVEEKLSAMFVARLSPCAIPYDNRYWQNKYLAIC